MKIKIIFSRTVVTQVDCWPEFRNVEIEVPNYLSTANGWHVMGAMPENEEATGHLGDTTAMAEKEDSR